MTDIETLFLYRLKQAEETLLDANKMIEAFLGIFSVNFEISDCRGLESRYQRGAER